MSNIPPRVVELIETFDRNINSYKKQPYNETQVRREFIDPFFEELGWDVTNKSGKAEAYKDVIHEDTIKIGPTHKAPDYSFRIGGVRKFFLETKKPSIDIKGDPHPAYQLRRYAWSANLPLSILSDFEEFAVYDCQTRPKQTDRASNARIMYLTYKEYIKRWDEIADIFSKDAIEKGLFDKFAAPTKAKRGTTTVDKEFLTEIEKWRKELARIIALKNTTLSAREINFAVQRTIDRIIFLRMCEDRGIETYGQLQAISSGSRNYPRLCEVFEKADHKYNSGLFYFHKEPGRPEGPDELTLNLNVLDNPLKYILHSLYYPQCPYEFSVLPPEILGNVYEQFLGSVIQVSLGRRTKVEPKPEVKKAGGIYYTPAYIVDYIVRNTVGKLCEGKTPKQIEKLKILDPACGSGSFLLGAYTCLLNHHRDWYVENKPEKYTKQIYQGRGGQWFLTIAEKKKILLNSIFGVDIDSQAVEVTKLSLLLKVLEGETSETIGQTYKIFHERALPDLGNNIKCGNSLIGPDFFDTIDPDSITDELRQKINAFNWEEEFPDIFANKNPGFDAVIGNPPYVQASRIMNLKPYFQNHYKTYSSTNDLYIFFVEQSLRLLSGAGLFSMIVSNKWIRSDYGRNLRAYISQNLVLHQLLDFGELPVFRRVGTFPCIILVSHKNKKETLTLYTPMKDIPPDSTLDEQIVSHGFSINITTLSPENWSLVPQSINSLLDKISSHGSSLGKLSGIKIRRGVLTGYNPAFIIDEKTKQLLIKQHPSANLVIKPFVSGDEIRRYFISWKRRYLIFTNRGIDISKYPSIREYLSAWRKYLEPKKTRQDNFGRKPGSYKWYEIQDITKYYPDFDKPKIVYGQFQIAPHFTFSPSTLYFGSNHYMILHEDKELLLYLCGILNSKVYFFYMKRVAGVLGDADKGGRLISQKTHILKFPVACPDVNKNQLKVINPTIVKLVDRMLDLHKKLHEAKIADQKTKIQRQINSTDKQIDNLVYELYNLTPQEIKIIEEST